jgi:ribose 5-phosphate isomerase RpiB
MIRYYKEDGIVERKVLNFQMAILLQQSMNVNIITLGLAMA